jgi:SpoU rRNA methylase family enzyme
MAVAIIVMTVIAGAAAVVEIAEAVAAAVTAGVPALAVVEIAEVVEAVAADNALHWGHPVLTRKPETSTGKIFQDVTTQKIEA